MKRAVGFVISGLLVFAPARAQTVRATGVTSVQFVQMRPLVPDSIAAAGVPGDSLIRETQDGRIVRCLQGATFCSFMRSGDTETVAPLIQDINVSAWGLGRGIRVYAQLRARTAVGGSAELWPRADDRFDALSAYVELDRDRFRLRGGRQFKTSGLGFYNFDGASALFRARHGLTFELFGGWSLARNLSEPRTSDAIAAIETFRPDARAILIGGEARYRPSFAFSAGALYQREIRNDRLGLYTEQVALDAAYRYGRGSLSGTIEADLAALEINDARLLASYGLRPDLTVQAYGRIYEPFFELWTIWGAFDPVGFSEVGGGATWRSTGNGSLELSADFSRRWYGETSASTVFGAYENGGWNLGLNGSFRTSPEWLLQGLYRLDFGFGAAKSEVTFRAQRDLGRETWIGASAIGFQRQFELRVANGTVYGGGLDGRLRLSPRSHVSGSLSAYRHFGNQGLPDVDWSQFRGMVRFEFTIGPEPGMASRTGGQP